MTITVQSCGTCPMFKSHTSTYATNFGRCRVTTAETYGTGNPPKACPLRDSALTVVLEVGR